MRVLVTGSCGFVGRHLVSELAAHGHEPVGFDLPAHAEPAIGCPVYTGDLRDPSALDACLDATAPEACVHLAGMAFVPAAWADPHGAMAINLGGTLTVLEAFRARRLAGPVVVVTSAEVYGREARPEPVREEHELHPSNLYGVSKIAADQAALLYHRHHGLHVMTARPQNQIGPGQSRHFVVSSFAQQLIALKHSAPADPVLRTGNLESLRDFTDVRDVARAYRLLLEKGRSGQAYNIASGRLLSIGSLLDQLCGIVGIQPRIETVRELYRPTDRPPQLATQKIEQQTGWQPAIPLATSLTDICDELLAAALTEPAQKENTHE